MQWQRQKGGVENEHPTDAALVCVQTIPGRSTRAIQRVAGQQALVDMSYRYVIRKYKLPREYDTRFQAMQTWRAMLDGGVADEALTDEFVVGDKQLSWWQAIVKQVTG